MESFNQYVLQNWMLFVILIAVVVAMGESLKYLMQWNRDSAQLQAENDLKREMVARGMSADDMLRVLNKTPSSSHNLGIAPTTKPINYLADLGKILAVNEVSSPILEAILTHFGQIPEEYQPTVYDSLKEMIAKSVEESALLAAVGALSKAYTTQQKPNQSVSN